CNVRLSTTVDEGKFNQVFYWLQKEGLIAKYPNTEPQDWFNKNLFAVSQVRQELIDLADIDDYWIGLSIWEMYLNMSNPFSLK
ncbi:restriction endonuclease, partial [bacterium]|nr:restriction endonuclease [bacterium]